MLHFASLFAVINNVQCGRGRRGRGRGRRQVNRWEMGRGNNRHEVPVNNQPDHVQPVDGGGGNDFYWEYYDFMDPFMVDWLPEFTAPRGIHVNTEDYMPVHYFKMFFPLEALELICNETNRYADQFLTNNELSRYSRFHKWQETTVGEIQAYVGLQIAMGMCQKNELEDYWGKYWLTNVPFSKVMSRNRFELITSFLHFADNEGNIPARDSPVYDMLWKVRPLMRICEPLCTQNFGPSRDLSIDESIIRFKGRVSF